MIGNKLLLRALLSLLIGTQSFSGTVVNVEQMAETLATTSMSEAELKGYLQGMGVNLDTVNPTYLEAVYAESQNAVGYYLSNNPNVTEVVETIIDADTGEITYQPISAENIGGVEYTQKGFVGATTNAAFIGALLADWGLAMYGNWQYDNDPSFQTSYNSLVGDALNSLINYADTFRAMYPGDEQKAYEAYKAFASGNSPRMPGVDAYSYRIWLDDEDIYKAWNGEGSSIDFSKYCNPNMISAKSIWRVWANQASQFWQDGASQFFNKKEIEDIARKIYEDQGVVTRYDLDYDDPTLGTDVDYSTISDAIEAVIKQAVNKYNNDKHDRRIPPVNQSMIETLMLTLGIYSSDNFVYCTLNGQGYDRPDLPIGYDGLSRLDVYIGYLPSNTVCQIRNIDSMMGFTGEAKKGFSIGTNLRVNHIQINTSGSITTGTAETRYISGGTWLGMNSVSRRNPDYRDQHLLFTAGGSAFLNGMEELAPSSLIDWAHSNLKFPTLDDLMDYLNSLPKFTLRNVNPKTKEQDSQDWIKIPFLKKIKDKIDEYYNENDLMDTIDFNDEDELPDYSEDAIVHRDEKDNFEDYKQPYDDPTHEETPVESNKITPSPSDIIIPPTGTTPNSPGTNPTPGGSPIIVPPIVPVGGSSSALFSVYNPSAAQIDSLGSYLWGSSIVELLSKFLQNPIDAVISLHQIYITPSTSGTKNIKLGYLDSGVSAACVSQQYESLDCGSVFVPEYYNDARDYSPWTQVQIYLPFIGIVPMSAEDIIGSIVNVKYGIDVYTGSLLCSVTVTKPDGATQTLYTYEGSGSVQYPLTGANMNGIIRGTLGAMTGGMIGGVSGALVGGLTGTLSGGASVSRSGGFGGNSGAMGYKKPYIIITRKIPDDAANYPHYYGLPANKTTCLVNCSGYTRVKNVRVDNIPGATQIEKEKIESILKTGVIVS